MRAASCPLGGRASGEETVDLPRLKFLKLEEVQELSALARRTISLPMLEEIRIELCPRLTCLPESLLQDQPQLTTLLLLNLEELVCLAQGTFNLPKLESMDPWLSQAHLPTSGRATAKPHPVNSPVVRNA